MDSYIEQCSDSSYFKFKAKVNHILGRIDNMQCKTKKEVALLAVSVAQKITIIHQLCKRAANFEGMNKQPIPSNIGVFQGSIEQLTANTVDPLVFQLEHQFSLLSEVAFISLNQ